MNQFVREFIHQIEDRFAIDSSDMSMGDWMCANTTMGGRRFSFDRYPFQKKIADDMFPLMDVIKPSQVGATEIQVRKALGFLARNRGTSLIFTLPSEAMFERMSTTRILPLVRSDKVFNPPRDSSEPLTRSRSLMQIGTSFLYVTGAGEGDATSISADAVFNDEVDLTDQSMLALFKSRLQNSDWKINHRFSTPTYSNFGIDLGFQASDQHQYMIRCPACNHWQTPLFTQEYLNLPLEIEDLTQVDERLFDDGTLDASAIHVCCAKCRARLDLADTSNREWVPKYPSRSNRHRGYQISPFSTHRLPPSYIFSQLFEYRRRDNLKGFRNTVLGETDEGGSTRLTDADIDECFTSQTTVPTIDSSLPSWLGIDVGQTCHLVLGQGEFTNKQHLVQFISIPVELLNETVTNLMKKYNIVRGSCDRHPYTPTANALRDLSDGIILPAEYRGTKTISLVKSPYTDQVTHVQVDRTFMLDSVAANVRDHTWSFSGYGNNRSAIKEHLKDMIREENPEQPAKWVKLTGNDHYFHAMAFMRAAMEIEELIRNSEDDVETRSSVMVALPNMTGFSAGLYSMNKQS